MVMENKDKSMIEGDFYINCLTLDGIPLFSNKSNEDLPSLSFPVLGSVNGIHTFLQNNNTDIKSVNSQNNVKIVWKDFLNIKLILVILDKNSSEKFLERQLENIYNCLVMVVGENEFKNISNIEKLKRKLRLCIPLIMTYLRSPSCLVGNFTGLTDIILHSDISLLQNSLNAFTEECQSEFGCLIVHNKVIAGTEKFWQLIPIETTLILYLCECMPVLTACDMPIFLPHGSPNIPHRMVVVNLVENVNVLTVCGPEPSLDEILHRYVNKHWLPYVPVLKSCVHLHPRSFSSEVKLDQNLCSFLLENKCDEKCLSSFYPHGSMTASDQSYLSDEKIRKNILKKFYKSTVDSLFNNQRLSESKNTDNKEALVNIEEHDSIETYICTEEYKCIALQTTGHNLFVLYSNEIPTYTLSMITKQTLKQLTKNHNI